MAAKKKGSETKIKVVEVPSEEEVKDEETTTSPQKEEPKEEKPAVDESSDSKDTQPDSMKEATPQVTSFSQLDSQGSVPSTESTPAKDEPSKTSEEMSSDQTKDEDKEQSAENIKNWLKEVRPDTTKDVEKKAGFNFKTFIVFVVVFAVIGALVGGALYYKNSMSNDVAKDDSMMMGDETPTPTSTPTPEPLSLEEYKLSVLNGSGVAGAAAGAKDTLTESGFTEDNIETGNADSTDYETTTVSIKSGSPEGFFETISESLGTNYTLELSEDELDETSTFDAIIILGVSK